jgi:hypothetical protein
MWSGGGAAVRRRLSDRGSFEFPDIATTYARFRAFARYRFNPFVKALGRTCRHRYCRHRSKTRGVTFERGAPLRLVAAIAEGRCQSRVKGSGR